MKRIAVVGEILVEIMADTAGEGFAEPQALTGPFPSGAPAIFADQAARLGAPVAIVSAVGDDDFGRCNLERLTRDGVDVSAVHVDRTRPTGSAFVRYRADGNRDFLFNLSGSACGRLEPSDAAREAIASADHLHVTGSSLAMPDFAKLNLEAASAIRARGGTVSFDPNARKEMLDSKNAREAMERMLAMCNLYLPSGDELGLLASAGDAPGAVAELLARGVAGIVHKNGRDGATYHGPGIVETRDALDVAEIDPTGAGDCFAAGFVTSWLAGADPGQALDLAVACGALAVTRRGPMEGAATRAEAERALERGLDSARGAP